MLGFYRLCSNPLPPPAAPLREERNLRRHPFPLAPPSPSQQFENAEFFNHWASRVGWQSAHFILTHSQPPTKVQPARSSMNPGLNIDQMPKVTHRADPEAYLRCWELPDAKEGMAAFARNGNRGFRAGKGWGESDCGD